MKQILIIAWRELTRLRKRFSGSTSPLAAFSLLVLVGLSAFAARDTISLGSGLYQVGVTGDVPPIQDNRFTVIRADPGQGQRLLDQHAIDILIAGDRVYARADHKSQYAVHALKQYMEEAELARVSGSYPESQAFPLRVGVNYLSASQAPGQGSAGDAAPSVRPEEVRRRPSLMSTVVCFGH